jgi:hypothetical protein
VLPLSPLNTNQQWTWVAGVTTVVCEALGGGGAGGGATGNPCTGGGGKGGSYAKVTLTKGAESVLDIIVGGGGAGGAGGAIANGKHSTVTQNSVLKLRASGGAPGATATANSTNGTGASTYYLSEAPIGDVTRLGGNGGTGDYTSGVGGSGGGGAAAHPSANGGNASANAGGTNVAGAWADGVFRSANGANGVGNSTAGAAAGGSFLYGGGCSGGKANNNTDRDGGFASAGSVQGVVVLTWTDPPPFTTNQNTFGFYADGTESGSTALAAQATDIIRNITTDPAAFQLRCRIQETGGAAGGVSSDDYTLFISDTGLAYEDVRPPAISSFWGGSGVTRTFSSTLTGISQSFVGTGTFIGKLWLTTGSARFVVSGSPTGNVVAKIYAHSGTFGTSSIPTGSAIAISDAVPAATCTGEFVFPVPSQIGLVNGTNYVWTVEYTDGTVGNTIAITIDNASTHPGNSATLTSGTWTADGDNFGVRDWRLQTNADKVVSPYVTNNLTEGGTTTNRLGAGSGSFVGGKVAKYGEAINFALTAGNHTELVYSLALNYALLAAERYIDFKIYRNGTVLNTYGEIPRITLEAAVVISLSGSATGTSAASGTVSLKKALLGTATGVGACTGQLQAYVPGMGYPVRMINRNIPFVSGGSVIVRRGW